MSLLEKTYQLFFVKTLKHCEQGSEPFQEALKIKKKIYWPIGDLSSQFQEIDTKKFENTTFTNKSEVYLYF